MVNILLYRYAVCMKNFIQAHNFGLKHCLNWDCVMHASLSIEEVDIKGNQYCKTCAESVEGYKIL